VKKNSFTLKYRVVSSRNEVGKKMQSYMTYILSLVKPVNLEVNKTITLRNFFGHIDIFGIRYITVNNF